MRSSFYEIIRLNLTSKHGLICRAKFVQMND